MDIAFIGAGRVVNWQLERFKLYNQLNVVGVFDPNESVKKELSNKLNLEGLGLL